MELFEGKYDEITGLLVDVIWFIIKKSKEQYDQAGIALYATKPLDVEGVTDFKYQVIIKREEGYDSYSLDANTYANKIIFTIFIDPEIEPLIYAEVNNDLQMTVRHEIEHILQEKKVPNKMPFPSRYMLTKINKDPMKYFMADHEIEAMVAGFYRMAKTQKEKIDVVIQNYLNYFVGDGSITTRQAKMVKDKWLEFAKTRYPAAQYRYKRKINEDMEKIEEENINPYDKIGTAMAKRAKVPMTFKKKKSKKNQNAMVQKKFEHAIIPFDEFKEMLNESYDENFPLIAYEISGATFTESAKWETTVEDLKKGGWRISDEQFDNLKNGKMVALYTQNLAGTPRKLVLQRADKK